MAKGRTKLEPELVRATFYCPVLDRAVDIDGEDMNFHGYYAPGGFQQDGYSEVTISFMCGCGDSHRITIYDD